MSEVKTIKNQICLMCDGLGLLDDSTPCDFCDSTGEVDE